MKKKSAQQPEATARAKFATAHLKPQELVTECSQKSDKVKANPNYGSKPEVQAAITKLDTSVTSLDQIEGQISLHHSQLVSLETARIKAIAQLQRANDSLVAVINEVSGGSEEEINKWGFEVRTRKAAPSAVSTDAPTGLRAFYDRKTIQLRLQWKAVRSQRGYLIQIGDGTPAGWGSIIHIGEHTYTPQGLQPGQHVSVRVAVIRKDTQSDWSDALAVVVR
jgi:hypothetical protein